MAVHAEAGHTGDLVREVQVVPLGVDPPLPVVQELVDEVRQPLRVHVGLVEREELAVEAHLGGHPGLHVEVRPVEVVHLAQVAVHLGRHGLLLSQRNRSGLSAR